MGKKKLNKKVSIQAVIAEKLLWTFRLKKPFETLENANKYLEKRYERNTQDIKLPRLKNEPKLYESSNVNVYVFNKFNKGNKIIVYLHGGSYNSGPIRFHFKFLDKLHSKTKIPIVLPLYPKAPNYNYLDAYEVLDELYLDMLKLKYDEVILMGDSAGGGLATSLYQKLFIENKQLPSKLILISPWVDISMDNPEIDKLENLDPLISKTGLKEMGKVWAKNDNPSNYLLSPIYGNLSNLPETTIFVGTHEIFLPDLRKFKNLLLQNKIKVNYFEYEAMNHAFVLYPIPEAKKALRQIVSIIKK